MRGRDQPFKWQVLSKQVLSGPRVLDSELPNPQGQCSTPNPARTPPLYPLKMTAENAENVGADCQTMMTWTHSTANHRPPNWLSTTTSAGAVLFGLAAALVGLAFLTDPTPTQDLPGIGLPVTLPISQPDFGHSVASYAVGMWLWEFTFPLVLLWVAEKRDLWNFRLLVTVPVVYMGTLLAYCSTVYLPAVTPTPLGPAATGVCWAYCATGAPLWGAVTAAVVAVGLLAWLAARRQRPSHGTLAMLFGALSLPLGLPAIYWGYRVRDGPTALISLPS